MTLIETLPSHLFLEDPSEAQLQHALSPSISLINGPCKPKPTDFQAVLVLLDP